MGNSIGGRKRAKVMKINGETLKLKTPIQAWDVVKDHPGHVLLDSEAVKHLGIRAKPLEPQQHLKPKKVYFLVELPKFPDEIHQKPTRRVRSGINMSAKDRLECLMLSRRSVSDLTMVRKQPGSTPEPGSDSGHMRVRMRLPKSQFAKMMEESGDGVEVAEKIISLYMGNGGGDDVVAGDTPPERADVMVHHGLETIGEDYRAADEKRVRFVSTEGEIRLDEGSL